MDNQRITKILSTKIPFKSFSCLENRNQKKEFYTKTDQTKQVIRKVIHSNKNYKKRRNNEQKEQKRNKQIPHNPQNIIFTENREKLPLSIRHIHISTSVIIIKRIRI